MQNDDIKNGREGQEIIHTDPSEQSDVCNKCSSRDQTHEASGYKNTCSRIYDDIYRVRRF